MSVLIEIFHDQASGRLPTEAVHEGLELVAEHAGNILVTRETRQIKLTDSTSDYVDTAKIRWPRLPANFSIILTDRPLSNGSPEPAFIQVDPFGRSQKSNRGDIDGKALLGVGIALISTHVATSQSLPITTAHEMGHLFEILSKDPESGHCVQDDCIMSAASITLTTQTIDTSTRSKRLKHRLGRPEFLYEESSLAQTFCGDCAEELAVQGPIIAAQMALKTMLNFDKL